MDIIFIYKETAASEEDLNDVLSVCDSNNVTYSTKKVPGTQPQAALELLIPTAVIVYIAGPFAKAYFSTLGKRAGEFTANLIGKLMKKCFGSNKSIDEKIVTVGGEVVESEFSRSLSFSFKSHRDSSVTLLIKESTTEESLNLAFMQFMSLLQMYDKDKESCPLYAWIENDDITRNWDQLLCFSENNQRIEFIDYVMSSKSKTLVTCPIDDAWEYQR